MNIFLILAFLFFIGSVVGWVIELLFRRFISSANPERKWINPGFCTGPYIPLYGTGLCLLYLLAGAEKYFTFTSPIWNKLVLFLLMTLSMTAIEYIAGFAVLKLAHVRLWDYRNQWGNVQGLICPKFSLIWAALGAVYYFLIHPRILRALAWLSHNLAFSFVIGLFFGVFVIDVVHSAQLIVKIRQFAAENHVVVRYEHLKQHIRREYEARVRLNRMRFRFFRPFHSDRPLAEYLKELRDSLERRK